MILIVALALIYGYLAIRILEEPNSDYDTYVGDDAAHGAGSMNQRM